MNGFSSSVSREMPEAGVCSSITAAYMNRWFLNRSARFILSATGSIFQPAFDRVVQRHILICFMGPAPFAKLAPWVSITAI